MRIRKIYIFAVTMFFIIGCSSTQETIKEDEKTETPTEEVYVFDEVPTDTVMLEPIQNLPAVQLPETITKFYVQIGAFTTKDKAQTFAKISRKALSKEVFIRYSPDVELFIVTLAAVDTKMEAEKVRNELWKKKDFKDAFILISQEVIEK